MNPTGFIGKNIILVLSELREVEEVLDYSKTEGDEFLQLKERGFYLHSKDGSGKIFDCRIFFKNKEGYFPAAESSRGSFAGIESFDDLNNLLGCSESEIRSVKIPGRPPTLQGKNIQVINSLYLHSQKTERVLVF